ncbi:uncharacterized protein LOC110006620 [Amborella trichopoda]|uniref:uncharacterized protein LOC110006620 n=1 Tax=Amborella trichopoda TaxID=13333 RepID=UPI0009BECACE|nr:uncharacterized protein LOC110006620 [Amborella trichopoda]|eukprot:XP_020518386.1 uncharacterized protein LOC110006620 [Amborella trichopoda]
MFAHVAHMTIVRTLIFVAVICQGPLYQFAIKNTFLNGDLAEEAYMKLPLGVSDPTSRSHHVSAMFVLVTPIGCVILLLYVDDMIISGDDETTIHLIKQKLNQLFEMKYLGFLKYFWGLEVVYSPHGHLLSQLKYATYIIYRARLANDTNHTVIPTKLNVKLYSIYDEPLSDRTFYWKLIGSLIYVILSWPNIAYVIHIASKFVSVPRSVQLVVVLCITPYIQDTLDRALLFSSSSTLGLHSYSDSDFSGDTIDQ